MKVAVLGGPALHAALADHDVLPVGGTFGESIEALQAADVLVADATTPATDVGWAVAWMLAKGRLVVVTVRRDAVPTLAPLLRGNPSPWQRLVPYADDAQLRAGLAAIFPRK